MTRSFVAGLWGFVFGAGIGVAGLARPDVIQGALDFTGEWNPAVFIAVTVAACIYHVGYRLALRREKPWFAAALSLPTQRKVDRRLVLGAALFGAGWGLAGMCPGATMVALPSGDTRTLVFMLAVMFAIQIAWRSHPVHPRPEPNSGPPR